MIQYSLQSELAWLPRARHTVSHLAWLPRARYTVSPLCYSTCIASLRRSLQMLQVAWYPANTFTVASVLSRWQICPYNGMSAISQTEVDRIHSDAGTLNPTFPQHAACTTRRETSCGEVTQNRSGAGRLGLVLSSGPQLAPQPLCRAPNPVPSIQHGCPHPLPRVRQSLKHSLPSPAKLEPVQLQGMAHARQSSGAGRPGPLGCAMHVRAHGVQPAPVLG